MPLLLLVDVSRRVVIVVLYPVIPVLLLVITGPVAVLLPALPPPVADEEIEPEIGVTGMVLVRIPVFVVVLRTVAELVAPELDKEAVPGVLEGVDPLLVVVVTEGSVDDGGTPYVVNITQNRRKGKGGNTSE